MFRHSVFGVRLECDFPLPDLSEQVVDSGPTWRVETRRTSPPLWASESIGSETVYGDVCVRAYASHGVLRLAFDDTGTFDVRIDERTISWYPGPGSTEAAVRADLLGRVMALAAHAEGRLALHASAVSIQGRAVAFLGPKHAGKSTFALALVRAGARLLADDCVVVRFDGASTPRAAVGVQRPRLWSDSVRALELAAGSSAGEKPTLDPLPPDQLERAEVPLALCYILTPGTGHDGAPVTRGARLTSIEAALAFVRFAKLGALLGGTEAPTVLDRATVLARAVPMHALRVARDLAQLDAVAAEFVRWHEAGAAPNAVSTA